MLGVMPFLSGTEVVVERDALCLFLGQERVGDMAADEPSAANDDHPLTSRAHVLVSAPVRDVAAPLEVRADRDRALLIASAHW